MASGPSATINAAVASQRNYDCFDPEPEPPISRTS
jgi:hypothetical protein